MTQKNSDYFVSLFVEIFLAHFWCHFFEAGARTKQDSSFVQDFKAQSCL